MLGVICIPLVFSFYSLILQSNDYSNLQNIKKMDIFGKEVSLNILHVNASTKNSVVLELEIISKASLQDNDYEEIKKRLSQRMGKHVSLHVSPKIIID